MTSIGKSVLIVDDDDDFRVMASRRLGAAGYHVVTASSAEQALVVLRAGFKPSAIVLDVHMPGGMAGDRFCEEVRRERGFERVPIVVMTVHEPRHLFGWVVAASKDDLEGLVAAIERYAQ